METRVAVMSIIVENQDSVERLNGLLHDYGEYIIGHSLPSEEDQHFIGRSGRTSGHHLRPGR